MRALMTCMIAVLRRCDAVGGRGGRQSGKVNDWGEIPFTNCPDTRRLVLTIRQLRPVYAR